MVVLPSQKVSGPDMSATHRRSNTVSGGRSSRGKRGSRQKSPGSGNPSPMHGAEEPRKKKKKDDKKRKQDRADKHSATKENLGSVTSSLNPSQVSVAAPPQSPLEEKEEDEQERSTVSVSPSRSEYSDISQVDVTASLHTLRQTGSFSNRNSRLPSTSDSELRRARSDAHLLGFGRIGGGSHQEEHHHVCPPERKQFYRQIMKRINTGARHRIEPATGGIQHVSRLRSENLALGNPFGPMWEQLWREIQAYLGDMTQMEYDKFKYKVGEQVEAIISKVSKFKVGSSSGRSKEDRPLDHPEPHSTKETMEAVAKKLTFQGTDSDESAMITKHRSDVGELSSGHESSGTLVADSEGDNKLSSDTNRTDAGTAAYTHTNGADPGLEMVNRNITDVGVSLTASSLKSSKNKYCFSQFLSELQLTTLDEVDGLLDEMYTLESRYPNRYRLGDEHPRYNDLSFKVCHLTLVLWFKVTTSLADKLCSLSAWLEVPVVIPDICREVSHMTIGEAGDRVSGELESPQLSPKSPRHTRRFVLGTSDSGSEYTPTSSLKASHAFPRSNAIDVTKSIMTQLDQNAGPYRNFVNRGLKRKGLTYTVKVFTG